MVARGLNMPCRLREHGMFGPTSEKRHGVTALEDLARLVVLASCSSPSLDFTPPSQLGECMAVRTSN
ncbi:hypothetical protein NC653_010743 [Populus alba x Populus x berolinensis]|uniref:Uncharacterized protein n=1 Tax=Populus alba x Populus x berolinensis TaxID=444605 RepID=A0AAD6W5I3_9ROSI|nr:hypothetical protein NC653_010743 [Populus alba x Populus x berolinensis]